MEKPGAKSGVLSLDFLQRLGQLIGTGGAAAALNAFQTGNGFVNIHAGHQAGDALGVAGAAAFKGHLLNGVAVYLDGDGAGAGSVGLVSIHRKASNIY